MRVRITHVALPVPGLGQRHADALGVTEDGDEPRRVFVPGWLPCGECGRCRRALVGACSAGRALFAAPGERPAVQVVVEIGERFVTPVDVPPGAPRLADETAAGAGAAAALLDATASAGLTPGDLAIWIGDGVAGAGAAFCAGRGCSAFWLPTGAATAIDGVTVLAPGAGAWNEILATADAGGPPGRRARRLFVTAGTPDWAAATALAEPGATIAVLTGGALAVPPGIELPGRARLLALGGYHPDLIAEALAALRRGEVTLERGGTFVVEALAPAGEPSA